MVQKLVFIVALVAFCIVSIVNGKAVNVLKEHNVVQCPNATQAVNLLCTKDLSESGKIFQHIKEYIDCPATGVNTKPITCIQVINQMGDDGGDASIVTGGVGYTSVEIELISQTSKGLDYHIDVYTE
ncbi:hypothetical protein ABEB36_010161 [Hypothenemus hampei]|uniref:Uncharacterized protein n=1 Tax=Hypothenemus hampei TaxID=57062 RepID=A0ABD1EJC2_HYPHA